MVTDFLDGRPLPPGLGQTETPVNILPTCEIDMGEPLPAGPALALTFRHRTGAEPAAVTLDLLAAYAAPNRFEISLGGSGLAPNEAGTDLTAANGVVRLVLRATEPAGAADRVARLAAAVNGAPPDPALPAAGTVGRSFVACEAEPRAAA